MFKRIFLFLISGLMVSLCSAQEPEKQQGKVVDSSSFGDTEYQWINYETMGIAQDFIITGGKVWYTTGGFVATTDTKTHKKRKYPKLGETPSTGVKSITSGDDGSVWFGGENGVIMKKGGSYKLFNAENGLAGIPVNSVFKAKNGDIWAACNGGVSVYNGSSWRTYRKADGVAGKICNDIIEDKHGGIWVSTNKGISVLKNGTWKTFDMSNGLTYNKVGVLGYDKYKDEVWMAVGEADVQSYSNKNQEWQTFMDIRMEINDIMCDTQSRIWFSSSSGPLLKYNGFEWVSEFKFPVSMVNSMFKDKQGNLCYSKTSGILFLENPYPY